MTLKARTKNPASLINQSKILHALMGLVVLCALPFNVFSQYVVTGKVTDAKTGEAIPFAAVQFLGTGIGVTTDFEGKYTLSHQQRFDSLQITVMGYAGRIKPIPKDSRTTTLDFQLNAITFDLGEVVIHAGANPAHRILHEAAKRKDDYNFERADGVKYSSYQITDIALTNLNEGFRQNRSMRQFTKIFDSLAKTAGEDGKIVLPFFVSENSSEIYRRTAPKYEKEIISANRSSGYLLDDLSSFAPILGASYQKYNFNNNWLNVFDRNFQSPIADGALLLYEAYLLDTVLVNGVRCFELKIKPKNQIDIILSGKIWIGVEDYALYRISAETGYAANLNFVRKFVIQQDYEKTSEGYCVPLRSRVLLEIVDFPGLPAEFILKFNNYYSNYEFGNPMPATFFDKQIHVRDGADRQTEAFWDEERLKRSNDTVTVKRSFATIDSIRQNKHVRTRRAFLNLLWKGYHPISPNLEFGHWMTLFGYNTLEGLRLQITPRTSYQWSNIWEFKGMAAYGFNDKRMKYGIEGSYFFNREKWTRLTVSYLNDDIKLASSSAQSPWLDVGNFLPLFQTFTTQFPNGEQIARVQKVKVQFQTDFGKSKTHVWNATHRTFEPYFPFEFIRKSDTLGHYKIAEISYGLLFAKKRTEMIVGNERYFMEGASGNSWEFRYAYAIPLNKDYLTYHRIGLKYRRIFRLGMLGSTRVTATASTVVGHVPNTEIVQFQGNNSLFETYEGYNGMAYNEFIADQSIELQIRHYFEGLFFNRIPLMKHLRLREVVGGNMIFSRVHQIENLISDPNIYRPMTVGKPYVEVYYSIDNIFKFLRVTAIHRLTYLNHKEIPSAFGINGFSIKISANFSL